MNLFDANALSNFCKQITGFCLNGILNDSDRKRKLISQRFTQPPIYNDSHHLNYDIRNCITSRQGNFLRKIKDTGFFTVRVAVNNEQNYFNSTNSEIRYNGKVNIDHSISTGVLSTSIEDSEISLSEVGSLSPNYTSISPRPNTINKHLNSQKSKSEVDKINVRKTKHFLIPALDLSHTEKRNSELLTYREHAPNFRNEQKPEPKTNNHILATLGDKKKLCNEWIGVNMLLLSAYHDRIIQKTKVKLEMLTFYVKGNSKNLRNCHDYHTIEEGSFGKVLKGRYCNSDVAVKIPNLSTMEIDPLGVTDRILREWKLLAKINHPNVIGFKGGIILPNKHVWLITDYIDGCDLHSLKYKYKFNIPTEISFKMTKQLVEVLDFLHTPFKDKGIIIHRDIKPENIIIDRNWNIHLCDFGDAEEFGSGNKRKLSGATWLYSPIELLIIDPIVSKVNANSCSQYNEKWDIWSLGCVLQEFFGGVNPFEYLVDYFDGPNQIYSKLVRAAKDNKYAPRITPNIHPLIKKIIEMCLQPDPRLRPTARTILKILNSI
ncbi:putative protein kinase [Cryptosporidium felis]|nr:putative protein kinase [Cryptosporidium felis]